MSDFRAKMHHIRFRLGSAQDPAGGAYSAPQNPYLYLRGPTVKRERERSGREGTGYIPQMKIPGAPLY